MRRNDFKDFANILQNCRQLLNKNTELVGLHFEPIKKLFTDYREVAKGIFNRGFFHLH